MIDSNSQFFAILTAVGEAKQANATALGVPWTFKEMAVGDANGTDPIPSRTQTKLINEWRRAPVNQVRTDPANPNIIITEQVIPSDVGGRWIREIGLFDADGDLVAVANCAPSFKPLLAQGTGKTQVIRMNFIVANTAQIVLKIDPAVVLATRQYVDDSLAAALPVDKTPGTYRVVTIDKRGVVVSGSNPTTLGGFGITDGMLKGTGGVGTTAPIVAGAASDLADCRFMSFVGGTSTDLPPGASYSVGVHIKFPNAAKNAVEFAGGSPDWLGGRIVGGDGAGVWRKFWHDGNFNPADKANKATTLTGYGITDTYTKPEIESMVSAIEAEIQAIRKFPLSGYKGLLVSATGTNALVVIRARSLLVGSGLAARALELLDLSINLATVGLGGLDAGSLAASSWYSVWVATNGDVRAGIAALMPIVTGNTTAGSAVVPGIASTALMRPGMQFNGANFPPGAFIKSVDSPTQITASIPATITGATALLRFVYEPVLPAGYSAVRVGAFPTDATANKFPLSYQQIGRIARYRVAAGSNTPALPLMVSGVQGSPSALVAISVLQFVPPTAVGIALQLIGETNSNSCAAPSGSYVGGLGGPNSPPLNSVGSTSTQRNTQGYFLLEEPRVYYFGQGTAGLMCYGWEDDL